MSLTTSRETLMSALQNAGIEAFYGMGAFTAPCARIYPAEPWVDSSGLANGRRTQRWEIWAVAGRTDSLVTFDELEAMVIAIDAVCEGMAGWSSVVWRRPAITDMGGTRYIATRGVVETTQEV
jgi:hypothetical protein